MDKLYQMYKEEATGDKEQLSDFLLDYHTLNTSCVAFARQDTILEIHDLDEYFENESKFVYFFFYIVTLVMITIIINNFPTRAAAKGASKVVDGARNDVDKHIIGSNHD